MPTTVKKAVPRPAKFVMPPELLKFYKEEMHFFPADIHPNGYIIFSRRMLETILERGTEAQRKEMVQAIRKLGEENAELVIMQR